VTGGEQQSKIIGLLNRMNAVEQALSDLDEIRTRLERIERVIGQINRQLDDDEDGIDRRLREVEARVFSKERESHDDYCEHYLRDVAPEDLPKA
jgi:hypothetical protein